MKRITLESGLLRGRDVFYVFNSLRDLRESKELLLDDKGNLAYYGGSHQHYRFSQPLQITDVTLGQTEGSWVSKGQAAYIKLSDGNVTLDAKLRSDISRGWEELLGTNKGDNVLIDGGLDEIYGKPLFVHSFSNFNYRGRNHLPEKNPLDNVIEQIISRYPNQAVIKVNPTEFGLEQKPINDNLLPWGITPLLSGAGFTAIGGIGWGILATLLGYGITSCMLSEDIHFFKDIKKLKNEERRILARLQKPSESLGFT